MLDTFLLETAQLERDYNLVGDRQQILTYIEKRSFLVPLLQAIPSQLKAYFPQANLYLDVTYDPEIAGDDKLEVAISPAGQLPDEAFLLFKQFKRNWWLEASHQAKNKLYIILEYR